MKKNEKDSPRITSINSQVDGKDQTITVRKISNGYIVRQSINYFDKVKDRHHWLEKETYSEVNPFEDLDNDSDSMFSFKNTDLSTFTES